MTKHREDYGGRGIGHPSLIYQQSYFWVDVKLFLVPCHTLLPHYILSFLWNSTLFFPSNIFIPQKFSFIKTWVPVIKQLLSTRHYASVSSCKEADREEKVKLFQHYFPTSRFAINIIFSAAKCRVLPASYCNPWEMVRINYIELQGWKRW